MNFYSKIVDQLNAAVQTRDAAKVALASRDTGRWSDPQLAGEGLEVGFAQVLDAAEEGDFGFCQPVAGRQLQVGKLKRAKGKIKAGISPRQQRRLLRLPVTPVLPFVSRYYGIYLDLAQGGIAA